MFVRTVLQSKNAEIDHLKSKQLLPFGFALELQSLNNFEK